MQTLALKDNLLHVDLKADRPEPRGFEVKVPAPNRWAILTRGED